MFINFNPAVSACLAKFNIKSAKEQNSEPKPLSNDELILRRAKKAFSDTKYFMIGACVLYFAVKKQLCIKARMAEEVTRAEHMKKSLIERIVRI